MRTSTTIHFAGLNSEPFSRVLRDKDILVSFADIYRRPNLWTKELQPKLAAGHYRKAMLDSGAFTVVSQGISIPVDLYGRFIAEHGHYFDTVVNLDDIGGNLAVSQRNQATLERYAGHSTRIMPVYHQGEPEHILEEYLARHPRAGIGFARWEQGNAQGKQPGTLKGGCRQWLDELRERIGLERLHGFAMTRYALEGYEFGSVDSTTWIAEYRALGIRKPTAAHAVWGPIGEALDRLHRNERARLSVDSYQWRGRERWCAEAKGQASTVLARFGRRRFGTRLGLALAGEGSLSQTG